MNIIKPLKSGNEGLNRVRTSMFSIIISGKIQIIFLYRFQFVCCFTNRPDITSISNSLHKFILVYSILVLNIVVTLSLKTLLF